LKTGKSSPVAKDELGSARPEREAAAPSGARGCARRNGVPVVRALALMRKDLRARRWKSHKRLTPGLQRT